VLRLLTCIACLCFASDVSADRRIWQVQSGEVLSLIALRFEVSVDELKTWNELDSDRLLVGQELHVDAPASEAEQSEAQAEAQAEAQVEAQAAEERAAERDVERAAEEAAEEQAQREQAEEEIAARFDGEEHNIARGQTFVSIASRYGVSVSSLRELNPAVDPSRLIVGGTVRVREERGRRIDHQVRRGDTLSRIATRHGVSVADLRRWNRNVRSGLRAGTTIRLWSEVPASTSESIGAPNRGQLAQAERLPQHRGYVMRDPERAYATLETTLWMLEAFDAVLEAHPTGSRVRVHDISRQEGGRMRGHRSHQSGRDVDIAYYQKRCTGPCRFRRLQPDQLDVSRQWTLLEDWLRQDRVEAIFIDYRLQEPLYNEARRRGATRGQLRQWFQYPSGRTYPLGRVRHFPKHRDHLHVRFSCPDTDSRCR
jgi:LysM repeat protein